MTKKRMAFWFLVGVVATWILILMLPASCRAEPKPWSESEKIVLAWSILASVADMYTTTQAMNNPYNYEVNPIIGRHPSDGKVVLCLGISQVIAVAIAHWHPVIDFPLIGKVNMRHGFLGFKAVVNTACAINNSFLDWEE